LEIAWGRARMHRSFSRMPQSLIGLSKGPIGCRLSVRAYSGRPKQNPSALLHCGDQRNSTRPLSWGWVSGAYIWPGAICMSQFIMGVGVWCIHCVPNVLYVPALHGYRVHLHGRRPTCARCVLVHTLGTIPNICLSSTCGWVSGAYETNDWFYMSQPTWAPVSPCDPRRPHTCLKGPIQGAARLTILIIGWELSRSS
jgi:hypothetical protein